MGEILTCFTIPRLITVFIGLALLVAAYVCYRVCLAIFRKVFSKDGVWKKLVESLRYPVLLIFYLIALIISVKILDLSQEIEAFVQHAITILIIAAIGWLLVGIIRAFYHNFVEKVGDEVEAGSAQRSMLTQVLFLYRFFIFGVVIITLATILMTFPYIKSVGVGLLGSAGIAGIALGVAARPILLNLMAGFQIALTKTIKIGDAVVVEGEFVRIEAVQLTHVVGRTWDLRRLILPISYFIDKPFQNWDTKDSTVIGSVFIRCDYSVPVDSIRKKVEQLVKEHRELETTMWKVQVSDCSEMTVEIRIIALLKSAKNSYDQRALLREKIIEFLQNEYPETLPRVRYQNL